MLVRPVIALLYVGVLPGNADPARLLGGQLFPLERFIELTLDGLLFGFQPVENRFGVTGMDVKLGPYPAILCVGTRAASR